MTSVELARGAWLRARAVLATLLVLFPASVAINVHFAPSGRVAEGDPAALAWAVVAAVLAALPSGAATRALLGVARPWRLDAGLGVYTAIQSALTLAWDRVLLIGMGPGAAAPARLEPVAALTVLVGGVALAVATLYWQLWPVGRAMGDKSMTARRSMEQMVGAVWASIAANLLLTGLAGFGGGMLALILAGAIKAGPEASAVIFAAGLVPAQVLGLAVTASIWRLRNRSAAAAELFD